MRYLSLSLVIAAAIWALPAQARRSDDAIAALMQCYARGTDAIGDIKSRERSPNPAAEAEAAGIAIYAECFKEDALFEAWFPGQAIDSQAAPNAALFPPGATQTGFDNWAGFVSDFFRGVLFPQEIGYDFTQHLIKDVSIRRTGPRRAQLVAYLNATHVTLGPEVNALSQCNDVANGTYTLDVVRKRGRWMVERLRLVLISFDPIFETGRGCGRTADPD